MERLCSLQCSSPELDLCAVDSLSELPDLPSVFGMLWRFIPVLDPSVSVMVSRDLDSRLTSREQAAVEEWLESGLAFHVMRDNPHHGTEILGGMWGARMDSGGREVLSMAMLELLDQVGLAGADECGFRVLGYPDIRIPGYFGHILIHTCRSKVLER